MAGLSTSTVALPSVSSATSRMSSSFWRQSSPATSSCENTMSFTGPASFSNSWRTAARSRSLRKAMPSIIPVAPSPLRPRRDIAGTAASLDQGRAPTGERALDGRPQLHRLSRARQHPAPGGEATQQVGGVIVRAVDQQDEEGRDQRDRQLQLGLGVQQLSGAREADHPGLRAGQVGGQRGGKRKTGA